MPPKQLGAARRRRWRMRGRIVGDDECVDGVEVVVASEDSDSVGSVGGAVDVSRQCRHRRRRIGLVPAGRVVVLALALMAAAATTAIADGTQSDAEGACADADHEADGTSCPSDDRPPPLWPKGDGLLATSLRYLLLSSPSGPPRNPVAALVVNRDLFLEWCASTAFTKFAVRQFNGMLGKMGVPKGHMFTEDEVVLYLFATICTLVGYYVLAGKRHGRNRRRLAEELRAAQMQVHELEEKLFLAQRQEVSSSISERRGRDRSGSVNESGEIRIFMDGAFDMMHYGHMNAFRLGRSLGTKLVVGVNSDESITACKGSPLMTDQERLTMVSGCKFVDEVVPGCPYVMNAEYVEYVISKLDVDYVVHGDDPCIVDGKDVYAAAKAAGKYQSIPRTEGVSTTDIVGRMLTLTKDHHYTSPPDAVATSAGTSSSSNAADAADDQSVPSVITAAASLQGGGGGGGAGGGESVSMIRTLGETSKFLTTSRMLRQFSAGMEPPEPGMRVVYMDGAWDMFHCGHVTILKEARKRGDYLIVGVHSDSAVNRVRGGNLPLMNLHERVLSVMGCRYVDDVLIDAPYRITPDMVASLKIAEVVHGSRSDHDVPNHDEGDFDDGVSNGGMISEDREDRWSERYRYPRESGIFTVLPSPTDFDLGSIVDRIRRNQDAFREKIARKKKAEGEYYDERYGRKDSSGGSGSGGGDGEGR